MYLRESTTGTATLGANNIGNCGGFVLGVGCGVLRGVCCVFVSGGGGLRIFALFKPSAMGFTLSDTTEFNGFDELHPIIQ